MKTIAVLTLLCASLYGADITTTNVVGDITTKVSERTAKNGKVRLRVETVCRGKTRVLATLSRPNKQGTLAIVSRTYLAGGEVVMVESDEDGDGVLDAVVVYRRGTSEMEAFTRQRDGSVQPVSSATLAAYKRQDAALTEFWDKALDKDADTDKLLDRLQKTLRDAEKAKTDSRK